MDEMHLTGMGANETVEKQKNRGRGERSPHDSKAFREANRLALDLTYTFEAPGEGSIARKDVEALIDPILKAKGMLERGEGDIRDGGLVMTGWQEKPERIEPAHLRDIRSATEALSREIDAFVSIGIGGSYLGIESTVRALTHTHFNQLSREERGGAPEIYFLGQNMDPDYFRDTLDMLRHKRVGLNVISKSGTTTETAIAFRILQQLLEDSLGEEQAARRILVTTDRNRGALRELADRKGYRSFVVPDDIGGRFSVLSDVGLVGLAMANIDIEAFVAGFRNMQEVCASDDFWKNPSLVHAAVRHAAWNKGKKVEVVAANALALFYVARWMEQLFPESEGHKGHGMWVSPSLYSEKLHANGQMVQQGERNILETFLLLAEHDNRVEIPREETNLDGLNFLPDSGVDMNLVNRKVVEGPAYAHYLGGVPNMTLEVPRRNAYNLGQVYYMMEKSVAVSGYLFGHNPFVQPGVEAYKQAMFALIGKPGFEDKAAKMEENLSKMERIRIHA
ncbi:MAG: glucose-6-phosphate isomerase [Deltaproteobacteria bacterium]|nr:glucose-6-phosphate isomerase [Deltaproteobacteria bacterium]